MVNILDLLKGQMSSSVMDKLSEVIGESGDTTSSALGSMLPSILGGLIGKGSTKEGASGILDFLNKENVDGSMFDNLGGLLGNKGKLDGLMKIGGLALPFILGGKKAGFLNILSRVTGLGSGKTSSLLSLAAPMVLGMIGKQVKKSGMGASGLMDLLMGQKDHVAKAMPAGMGDMLGLSSAKIPNVPETSTGGGGGFLKILIPVALIALAGWFFTKDGCGKTATADVENKMEEVKQPVKVQEPVKQMETEVKTKTGSVTDEVKRTRDNVATEATKEATDKMENASTTVKAETGTGASMDKFKLKFFDLFDKKDASSPDYTLTKMTFDPKSQRISYYSKDEFLGLAAALKEKEDAKITVKVHTQDGKNEKENKKLSTMRAEQIQRMLQTLGVRAKQMQFQGMGSKEAAKASNNTINIEVN